MTLARWVRVAEILGTVTSQAVAGPITLLTALAVAGPTLLAAQEPRAVRWTDWGDALDPAVAGSPPAAPHGFGGAGLNRPFEAQTADGQSMVQNRLGGALLGAVVGFGVGAVLGYQASSDEAVNEREFAGLADGLLGSAIGAPVLAHLFDRRRGSLWPSLALSVGLASLGYARDELNYLLGLAPAYAVAFSVALH